MREGNHRVPLIPDKRLSARRFWKGGSHCLQLCFQHRPCQILMDSAKSYGHTDATSSTQCITRPSKESIM
ncbi:rCG57081 [Rattus norvegicus]|uniref:RCG57081 n=1 Tax=Rattus norvegicus TaxID=10116 RepID=A6JD76_RAT|nr:rCG57081 [Rattus norvegicus]